MRRSQPISAGDHLRLPVGHGRHLPVEQGRRTLAERLRARLGDMEAATLTRVYAISDPSGASDPAYVQGLRAALSTALDHALISIERGEERAPPVPTSLLAQARMAARSGVGLDTVLRRYLAGYSLLTEFVIKEAEDSGLFGGESLQRLLRGQAAVFDRLVQAVSEEHGREGAGRLPSAEQRRLQRVKRLLAGELVDAGELRYELNAHHLGLVCSGPGAIDAVRDLAQRFDRSPLAVVSDEERLWVWLGSRQPSSPFELDHLIDLARDSVSPEIALAFGEAGHGASGWRLTHRQARACLSFAHRSADKTARYREVGLVASMLRDDLLTTSLHQLYLVPLEADRDGGRAARQTLRAYFASERNISAAAASLGVKRHTVTKRLRAIERALGRTLTECSLEVEAALRILEIEPGT